MRDSIKGKAKSQIVKQSRPRDPLPRPTVFRDKTKYSRTEEKRQDKKKE